MNLTTVTLGELVDHALEGVQAPPEVGRLVVRPDALGAGDGGFALLDATIVSITDTIEFADELMFVTGKSDDSPNATLSVIRGHYGTTKRAHAANEVGTLNPRWSRKRVATVVKESFTFLESNGLPLVVTDPMIVPYTDPYDHWTTLLPVPEGARRVYAVRAGTNKVANWNWLENLPDGDYPNSVMVRLPNHLRAYDGPYSITYQMPYRWSDDPVTETSTIDVPEGAQFLPGLYAAWRLTSDREVSRSQVDRSEEYQVGQPSSTGAALVRLKQAEFYGALDAAKRLSPPPRFRPMVSEPVFTGMSWQSHYS